MCKGDWVNDACAVKWVCAELNDYGMVCLQYVRRMLYIMFSGQVHRVGCLFGGYAFFVTFAGRLGIRALVVQWIE